MITTFTKQFYHLLYSRFYSSSPEATTQQDSEANRVDLSRRSLDEVGSSQERRRVGYAVITLDTPPLAAGSFISLLSIGPERSPVQGQVLANKQLCVYKNIRQNPYHILMARFCFLFQAIGGIILSEAIENLPKIGT
jgi:hypothetical protein